MDIPHMPQIGMGENIGDTPDKLNKFANELADAVENYLALFAQRIEQLYEFARLQDGVNEDIVVVVKAMQEQSDSRYDRLDARILSVLKRLDKLEGKH